MPKVLVLFAHPRLEKSRSNRALLNHLPPSVTFRDLYEIYPDFNVNIEEEQRLLLAHDILVFHHPLYWYSAPPLVKQWIDLVLSFGWAYGPGGVALKGKVAFHVLTTGGPEAAYQLSGFHAFTLADFLRPWQRTITLCGMTWLPPFAVHGTHRLTDAELEEFGRQYAQLLTGLAAGDLRPEDLGELKLLNQALARPGPGAA